MKKSSSGFTMIELLVVIGIMAILLAIVLGALNTSRIKSRDNVRVSDIQKIRLALEQYRVVCGVFPATLSLSANNARNGTCSATLGDFIAVIPTVPHYSIENQNPQQGESYIYSGLSTSTNGHCYDYHIAVQMEYGADNNYSDGESAEFLENDHDYNPLDFNAQYRFRCAGSGPLIQNAHDDSYGLYDFRSSQLERQ